jgi:predicted permease
MEKKPFVPTVKFAGTFIAVLAIPDLILGVVTISLGDWGLGLLAVILGLGSGVMGLIIRRGGSGKTGTE